MGSHVVHFVSFAKIGHNMEPLLTESKNAISAKIAEFEQIEKVRQSIRRLEDELIKVSTTRIENGHVYFTATAKH